MSYYPLYSDCGVVLTSHRHVQTNNEEALQFYKKFDFFITETKEGYYKTVEPVQKLYKHRPMKLD